MSSNKATVHRALAALRRAGFAGQDGRGRYVLGDEFLRLAFAHAAALARELRTVRQQGWAADDQENEPGVNCVAVPAFLRSPRVPTGAVSVSAPAYRTPLARLVDDVAVIRATVSG